MNTAEPIEVPATVQPQAVQRYQQDTPRELVPSSPKQVLDGLNAIKRIMSECMTEGQDYGKVPGCGDKVGLFQPGAQKLSMTFQLNPEVQKEEITDYPNYHRGYRLTVRVSNGPKFADGVGECSTMESKYRFRNTNKVCPDCGKETVLKSKNDPGWFCWAKKGGCGATFAPGSPGCQKIESQSSGKVDNENPADFWNTVRKMAFKRAFVHAIINATNTSELWSQDLEDLAANGVVPAEASKRESVEEEGNRYDRERRQTSQRPKSATPTPPAPQSAPTPPPDAGNGQPNGNIDWRSEKITFGKNSGMTLGELSEQSLKWYIEKAEFKKDSDVRKDTPLGRALDAAYEEMVNAGEVP